MNTDIFGNPIPPNEIELNVYHDEREIPRQWFYHSFCFIPLQNERKVLNTLCSHRRESTWESEIHFKELKGTNTENDLAKRWVDYYGNEGIDDFYYYLLGIDLQMIEKRLWKSGTRDHRIYNRFFQMGLYGAIKWFFLNPDARYHEVIINKIFSHERSREDKDEFHTRPIFETLQKSLSSDEVIIFKTYKIKEVKSDHEEEIKHPDASHFIQFADVIMGTFSQIYDNTSNHEGKKLCARAMLKCELPGKIMSFNPNSRYYKRYAVSFFPKAKITERDFFDKTPEYFLKSQFYNKRSMAFTSKGQMTFNMK